MMAKTVDRLLADEVAWRDLRTPSEQSASRALEDGLASIPEDVYRLQAQAERWLALVGRQQELAHEFRQLVDQQRQLATQWDSAGAAELAADARSIETDLRSRSNSFLQLEHAAVAKIADAIADASRMLRSE